MKKVFDGAVSSLLILAFWLAMCLCVVAKGERQVDCGGGKKVAQVETERLQVQEETPVFQVAEQEKTVELLATAYCSCEKCCGEWAKKRPICEDGKPVVYTASGAVAKQGRTVAADPSVYPYGTVFVIDENEYVVEDCGGSIKGENRVDFYFESHEDAIEFGKKSVVAFVKG